MTDEQLPTPRDTWIQEEDFLRDAIGKGYGLDHEHAEALLAAHDYHEQRAEHFPTVACAMADQARTLQRIAVAVGWPDDMPVEEPGELVEYVVELKSERDRARELLDGARQQCERRTAELAEAQVSIRHLQREAVIGHFVLGLEEQIRRLRRLAEQQPEDLPTGMSPTEIAAVVAGELAEVGHEVPGSPDAQRESADVWTSALHLLIANGGVPLVELEAAHGRIKQRLDIMEENGCSWSQAKRLINQREVLS